ncbi:MAG: hypothetical protein HN578_04405 [Rhodospirillales bacterium]|nr:hypothetical protein [Rhodospirillales bacterium]
MEPKQATERTQAPAPAPLTVPQTSEQPTITKPKVTPTPVPKPNPKPSIETRQSKILDDLNGYSPVKLPKKTPPETGEQIRQRITALPKDQKTKTIEGFSPKQAMAYHEATRVAARQLTNGSNNVNTAQVQAQNQATPKPSQSTSKYSSPYTKEFREQIHANESNVYDHNSTNWANEKKGIWNALGRYQMTEIALKDVGLRKKGKWTGKYGVWSRDDFLKNPDDLQERVLTEHLEKMTTYIATLRPHIGKTIKGIKANFEVNENNMLAAAHRRGNGMLSMYLEHLKSNNYKSDASKFPPEHNDEFLEIETRLRKFENIQAKK